MTPVILTRTCRPAHIAGFSVLLTVMLLLSGCSFFNRETEGSQQEPDILNTLPQDWQVVDMDPVWVQVNVDGESVPRILMLTARDGVGERVTGLDQGADDYLVKPFDFAELSARVRSLMRRDAGRSGAELHVGELLLDSARFEASRRGRLLDLTAKEFALLRYFMAHAGEVLSQERLLEHVWDENADPLTNTVRVTVGTLRRKLTRDDDPEPPIETVIGAGYRLRPDLLTPGD